MTKSIIKEKCYAFALQIIALYKELARRNEYVLSKQLLRSGTSIGANVEEALAGQSRADFLSKMSIASKEARETIYWLKLLRDSEILNAPLPFDLLSEAVEISNMLTSIVKTTAETKKLKAKN
ncbi:four helix bundle protein [Geomonas edaphica]|uniref:four helix bundle protein n=1 Tax=Geomonas edaphica TaxID=2570226 RepID=UPI0010A8A416|nr:four helix bundle protein [Geomonas edaphica]